jgi:hypothetical protein
VESNFETITAITTSLSTQAENTKKNLNWNDEF